MTTITVFAPTASLSYSKYCCSCLFFSLVKIGQSNYHDRDACLKHLIQPLGGEYGLSICSKTSVTGSLLPTHRQLFQSFYESVHKLDNDNSSTSWSMKNLLMKGSNEPSVRAVHGENFFEIMLNDIQYCGMRSKQTCSTKDNNYTGRNDSVEDQAAYALGYNLAGMYKYISIETTNKSMCLKSKTTTKKPV